MPNNCKNYLNFCINLTDFQNFLAIEIKSFHKTDKKPNEFLFFHNFSINIFSTSKM